jgi:hypothetical protein
MNDDHSIAVVCHAQLRFQRRGRRCAEAAKEQASPTLSGELAEIDL